MKNKHYDYDLQKWVIDGASNASDLELSNPGFLDSDGKSVSIDQGMTKVHNRLTKVEQNLAWIYQNGAKGGSGGSGGEGTNTSYTITVDEGDTVYTSTGSVDINVTINSGTSKRPFTLVAKNMSTNEILGTWKKYSLTKTTLSFTGLSGTVNIELSAYDANANYTVPKYVKVVAGAISLKLQTTPSKTVYVGAVSEVPLNFTVTNNTSSTSSFALTCNGLAVDSVTGITTSIRSLLYNARDIIFNDVRFDPAPGNRFKFSAVASTTLGTTVINSNVITFDITVADSNTLIIITDDISEFLPSLNTGETYNDLKSYAQGAQLGFSYYLSYGLTKYSTFNVNYSIYLIDGITSTLINSGSISNINRSESNRFVYSTVDMAINTVGQYYKIVLSGYAVNDPSDVTAQYTKTVTCKITAATFVEMRANNDMHTLLAYYSRTSGFWNTPTGTWNYPIKTAGEFIYEGAFKSKFPNGVDLSLVGVNGKTSGFLQDSDGANSIPAIVLKGESYGYLQVAEQMFPDRDLNQGYSFFQTQGFNISTTFKADKSSDESEVILSIGKYQNDALYTGYEITLSSVTVKIGTASTITCKLPQNQLLTVDLDVYLGDDNMWYFKIFLNGVLSAVTRVNQDDIDWKFGQDIYLGCRNDAGTLSKFSDVSFYDVKLYTSSQSEYAIVQNYIAAMEQASLVNGVVDSTLDSDFRTKNLFDSKGDCLIWDKALNAGKGGFLDGEELYNKLLDQMSTNTPYPVLLIEETTNSSTMFEVYSSAVFSTTEKGDIMDTKFPVQLTYIDKNGKVVIKTPNGVTNGVCISLQGTSSLSYVSKNFELYLGDLNADGKKLLFQPKSDWLPENEFTLKADVMDSAHVNNVVLGEIINGVVKNTNGTSVTPMAATPPMSAVNSLWADEVKATEIKSKIKHTSDGFPCLVFIRYAPDADGITKQPKFCGIYNFNLGRHAEYNLGLKLLLDYTRVSQDGPTLVSDYTEKVDNWNTGTSDGTYSIEINQNHSSQGAFQQDDLKIVKYMADVIYTSRDEETAYGQVQKFYTQMANMALGPVPKYTMDEDSTGGPTKVISINKSALIWNSKTVYKLGDCAFDSTFHWYSSLINDHSQPLPTGEESNVYWQYGGTISGFYNLDKNVYYNFSACEQHLNWNNACAYFMVALIFGMVDSMCKNMTLRCWGNGEWYLCFYDMDTAFGLDNSGQDTVGYWAHLHRWFNTQSSGSGVTSFAVDKNYESAESGTQQYFASWWNRIWEVLENLAGVTGDNSTDRPSISSMYVNLRTNLFPDPEEFIDKYYKSYTENTGSIMFNYDYKIKYLREVKQYDVITGTYKNANTVQFDQLKFLHGNRVMHVRDWFKKRILFLDGVYGIQGSKVNLPVGINSPITSMWSDNKVTGITSEVKFSVNLAASSKVLYHYAHDKATGSFWLDSVPNSYLVPMTSGVTIVYMYANKYVTKFENFKHYPWTNLNNIDLPLLEELDLSYLTNVDSGFFFRNGVYSLPTVGNPEGVGLKNIRNLILNNVKLIGDNSSAYTLDLANCSKLQKLDVSYSNITNIKLPDSAVLKEYNLSGTTITSLTLENQSFLKNLVLADCSKLTSVRLSNCGSIESLSLPSGVTTLILENCPKLSNLTLTYTSVNSSISSLAQVTIDNCPGLKEFNISGQNNPALKVELTGAWNLERLNISDTRTEDITLASLFNGTESYFKSLKSLIISRTSLSSLKFNDQTFDYLDLSNFADLDNIVASDCKKLTKVVCSNNEINPINLSSGAFFGCTSLQRVIGHFNITGAEVFKGCSLLALNDQSIYSSYTPNQFLPGSIVTNISFDSSATNLLSTFEGCSTFTFDDFERLIIRIGSTVTSIEGMFKGCSNINNTIERTIFSTCRNLTVIKEAFSGTRLTGTFYSRTSNYSPADESTWGILDYLPKLVDAEAAFDSTSLEWIDNNVFAPIIYNGEITYSPLVKVDHMFRNCVRLSSCEDTRVDTPIEGLLNSETFFTNLRNLINVYPDGVFAGCLKVRMVVTNDIDGNTLLFHTINKVVTPMILTSSLYSGVKLVGEIKNNVFGGISKTIYDGVVPKYYIPTFTSIQYPFNSSYGELTVNLSQMGSIFRVIGTTLLQAIGVFYGTTCIGSKVIPPDIFKGCTALNSIESLFSGLNLDNDGEVYIFPPTYDDSGITKGMFDDCRSLKTTRNLFNGCNNLKIQLIGEGFKNCQLKDVSGMFSNSGLFGIVPYRLFFMNKTNLDGSKSIVKTIANMSELFSGCWCLGYDKNRKIDLKKVLIPETETSSAVYAPWQAHIVETEGSPVSYKLNVQNIVKTYNYDRDDNLTIPNPNYVVGGTEPETISNPEYNPGEFAFDIWYLDGYGWDGTSSIEDQSGLDEQKSRLSKYFSYDAQQAVAISNNLSTEWYIESNQNYMIPTDLFRYCSNECTLSEVLSGLTWIENKVTINDATLEGTVGPGTKIEGLRGRIPVKLFQSLVTSSKFDGVFKNTYFDAFIGLQGMNTNNLIRGIMYPPDLLKYNSALTDIPNLFSGTTIPVGVDINTDLFFKLPSLKVINNLWSNCKFDSRPYNSSEIFSGIYSQFSFIDLFKYNTKITNASGLFAVINTGLGKGLLIIESALLEAAQNISNISNMFFYCTSLKGAVPLFYSSTYTALSNISGYLIGVPENNITNSSDVETRLRPSDWSQI